ncbi:MAG: YceI family protein [Acidobacteriota bacterium]
MRAISLVIALVAAPLLADPRTYNVAKDGKNIATFRYEDPVETVVGTTTGVSGTITADPSNLATASVEVNVELKMIDTGLALRDSHIRDEFVQTGRYPLATFKSATIAAAAPLRPNQPGEISVAGDFTVHGVTKRITIPVRVVLIPESDVTKKTRGPGDWVHATSTFTILLSDYGIRVPETFIDDRIEIKIDLFGSAKRN